MMLRMMILVSVSLHLSNDTSMHLVTGLSMSICRSLALIVAGVVFADALAVDLAILFLEEESSAPAGECNDLSVRRHANNGHYCLAQASSHEHTHVQRCFIHLE